MGELHRKRFELPEHSYNSTAIVVDDETFQSIKSACELPDEDCAVIVHPNSQLKLEAEMFKQFNVDTDLAVFVLRGTWVKLLEYAVFDPDIVTEWVCAATADVELDKLLLAKLTDPA